MLGRQEKHFFVFSLNSLTHSTRSIHRSEFLCSHRKGRQSSWLKHTASLVSTLDLDHRPIPTKPQSIPHLELILPLPALTQSLPSTTSTCLIRRKPQVEMPQHMRQSQLQLQVRQTSTATHASADAERIEGLPSKGDRLRWVSRGLEPAVWVESERSRKVRWVVVYSVHWNSDDGTGWEELVVDSHATVKDLSREVRGHRCGAT